MASETNVKAIMRKPKNVPTTSVAERVLEEYDVGKGVLKRVACIQETVVFAGDAFKALTSTLPAGAKVIFANYLLNTIFTPVTAVKIGIGISGTPSAFLLNNGTLANGTKETLAAPDTTARLAAASIPRVSAVDVSGNAAGTGTGSVTVTIVYEYLQLPV